jgi:cellulose biosynthesis protein BcsQ
MSLGFIVDSIALIDLDPYFREMTTFFGNGTADARVDIYTFVVNEDNEIAISGAVSDFYTLPGEGPLVVVSDNVLFNNDTYPMFEMAMIRTMHIVATEVASKIKK